MCTPIADALDAATDGVCFYIGLPPSMSLGSGQMWIILQGATPVAQPGLHRTIGLESVKCTFGFFGVAVI